MKFYKKQIKPVLTSRINDTYIGTCPLLRHGWYDEDEKEKMFPIWEHEAKTYFPKDKLIIEEKFVFVKEE